MRKPIATLTLIVASMLSACSTSNPEMRKAQMAQTLAQHDWSRIVSVQNPLPVQIFGPRGLAPALGEPLTVYIEGDGLAWINATTPSFDPTPGNPVALRMALADQEVPSVYMSRACQAVPNELPDSCTQRIWTDQRFSADAVGAASAALDDLSRQTGSNVFRLVGYSGGGAIAVLLAQRRKDVVSLVTVAGNLDTDAWTKIKHFSSLDGLNPADRAGELGGVQQIHFVGSRDTTVPPQVAEAYVDRFPPNKKPPVITIEGFDHACCWAEQWTQLRSRITPKP